MSIQWRKNGTPPHKKIKVSESVGKLMATIFSDCGGILRIDYKEKCNTTTERYFAKKKTDKLKGAIKEKWKKKSKVVLLLQDNALVHTSKVAKDA